MSLRTRINGLTAWVNLRLRPYDHLMNNVLMDLLTGTNMKMLVLSLTGRDVKKLHSLDGLTQQQKITRVEWVLDELKKSKVIPDDVFVDTRLFAMRSADHIFDLLWRLVTHDIWFVWERLEYLQHDEDEILTEVPFKWIPEAPPQKRKVRSKKKPSLLSGFGASSLITEKIEENSEDASRSLPANYEPFPNNDFMLKFKQHQRDRANYPSSAACILEMVNSQMKTVHEGKKLHCANLDDLVDSRVLCALANSFVSNTFTTEVLLNDRWMVNLVLRTTEKMFYLESPFDSEDLVEADPMTVCSYFSVFFMVGFKYRQSCAAIRRREFLERKVSEVQHELDLVPTVSSSHQRRNELKARIDDLIAALECLERAYDLEFCYKWMDHVGACQKEAHGKIHRKMKDRFDTLTVPRNITINDLCLASVINLSLTNGSGFYLAEGKETLGEGRRLILKDKKSGQFTDDFTSKDKDICRKMLRLPPKVSVNIITKNYPKYQIFLESLTRNKQLKAGSTFLYQVFPGTTVTWQKIFLKAVRDNEIESVKRVVAFFRPVPAFINCREPQSGNSPLYTACRMGHFDIALCLLENGANIDQRNVNRQTPLFAACEGLHRSIAHLLIEWGCDVHVKGPRALTAFETIKNDEFRDFLIGIYNHYSTVVPQIMAGDTELLDQVVTDHRTGEHQLCNLRSRCINGSTLLHTASYFDCLHVIRDLLKMDLDINLCDYKGATPLHRARGVDTMRVLVEAGARPSMEDGEGNTPLHVKCYGEIGQPSETEAVSLLLAMGARLSATNHRGLMPVHCAAMQGRIDILHMLFKHDQDGEMTAALGGQDLAQGRSPPSLAHLALANDFIDCAQWLVESDFDFKNGEVDTLLQRILAEQIKVKNRSEVVNFLLEQGASPVIRYQGGNTALHYAASMSGPTDVLELLLAYGADIDPANLELATPLFVACQCNNQLAASILLTHGANVRARNTHGLTAFDFIIDYDEWIESGYFTDEVRARLKAYSLKHARDLIRAISKKVKAPQRGWLEGLRAPQRGWLEGLRASAPNSTLYTNLSSQFSAKPSNMSHFTRSHGFALPPLQQGAPGSAAYVTH